LALAIPLSRLTSFDPPCPSCVRLLGRKKFMKKCSYCGAEYPDDTAVCPIDHTPFGGSDAPPLLPRQQTDYDFVPLSEADHGNALETLVKCRTLLEADMVASQLRAGGIEVFLPDEYLMQAVGWNVNTYGYVRVQVSPKDYVSAKNLLAESDNAG
jgi:hypothetical protein